MPEERRKLQVLGVELGVIDVAVAEATEPFSDYTLEDGTKLRVKSVATSVVRVADQFAPDGKPVYFVTTSPVVFVSESPLTKDPL
jgi:hypothetical protein